MKKLSENVYKVASPVYVSAHYSVVGKMESEGPLADCFDERIEDEKFGQETFEKGESQLLITAARGAIKKSGIPQSDFGAFLSGDLENQIIASSMAARVLGIPYLGLYGACSTMAESIVLGSFIMSAAKEKAVLCGACSHFCAAERQYRFPLEFGCQRTPTAQWTVTGAGATVLGSRKSAIRITNMAIGRVIDMGVTDANNMGAAMAPAAANTLKSLFDATETTPADYDAIVSGDLGQVGHDILLELMEERKLPLIKEKYFDCGLMIFDREKQDVHAGGSGCGCSASVLNGFFLRAIEKGEMKRILFMATGALMSPTSSQQGESIPGVAHAVVFEREEESR
ncbi:MAG: stage V sporulation protein AD [Eubacteriales bacterium]|nr:stage V sporulation protein AD [Eubacteriales bacterium]MDD3881573.1 stage V sporulation protein AD [Eubacteriales bacterium]MDD4513357.1 stage V sporulation protein AD [Eubacteriales bacterium]